MEAVKAVWPTTVGTLDSAPLTGKDPTATDQKVTEKTENSGAETPLYNSRILRNYLEFLHKMYPEINEQQILDHAGVEPYQIKDEGHWFTQSQHDRFHEKLVELTGNPDIAMEAGRYVAHSKGAGFFRQYTLAWIGPSAVFSMLGKLTSKFTRSALYESRKISPNAVEITVIPREGVQEKPYQCQNRFGMIQAVLDFFNYSLSKAEHPECVFKGGRVCRYLLTWESPPSTRWKRIRNLLALLLASTGILLVPYFPWDTLALVSILFSFTLLSHYIDHLEKKELTTLISHYRKEAEAQIDQIDVNYQNARLINEIGGTIAKKLQIRDLLENIMHLFRQHLDYERGMILLADPSKTHLSFSAGYGIPENRLSRVQPATFSLHPPQSRAPLVRCFHQQKPLLIDDPKELKDLLPEKNLADYKKSETPSSLCVPIVYERESLGVLLVDRPRGQRALTQTDLSLLMGIANQIGISINNARVMEQQKEQFKAILKVLAASIDARDPLTAGHSEKVNEYAVGIARALGMDAAFCEVLSIAALLHDYGKIGIRDDILKKPGKLTEEEFREIRSHAAQTRSILEQMNFKGAYREIPAWAGAHHEKFDGSGYPKGLKGEEIPLGARIIAVADVFEALTSKRHYRDPMPTEEALEILKQESNKAFDGKVVEAFLRYYQTTLASQKAEGPRTKPLAPGSGYQNRFRPGTKILPLPGVGGKTLLLPPNLCP